MAGQARVIVGVSGSLNSLTALHRAIAEARRRDALLVPVLAWTPPGGETAYLRSPCPPLLREWERSARLRLAQAFDDAFGGRLEGVRMSALVVRGEPGEVLTAVADRPDDLLVVSTGGRRRVTRLFRRSVARHCLEQAVCPVLAVPPSELRDTLSRAHRVADPLALLARTAGA
ncbi:MULTISPECIES: universal stress protein [Streptomycetaceae]|uniref:UspA domain-containing protein n=1 Tax=Streptantibioticus cattleyicolor (strain ATCC 35852 / DSM 46488 / JCM 4925 / NBRC 14057 / NRRL 8057) TaxID=1003195 RepID=F8JTA3_STREN|nr:universal stress protein [Streptantibioticus cattleyicolor]AEW94251.1 hypothetical protein SCATT_18800 [Streptantibioticus cattleyicolor NRRL 8057 = DSM 46488]MYS58909.1 universal stress protein [Streptomyces sp. SID5468]CCB74606.1 conserved protein of unknown function [Streptantibioticus cattleyicolor NRRL 8057 = DSM 46488]